MPGFGGDLWFHSSALDSYALGFCPMKITDAKFKVVKPARSKGWHIDWTNFWLIVAVSIVPLAVRLLLPE